jgi:hypothetical protein
VLFLDRIGGLSLGLVLKTPEFLILTAHFIAWNNKCVILTEQLFLDVLTGSFDNCFLAT